MKRFTRCQPTFSVAFVCAALMVTTVSRSGYAQAASPPTVIISEFMAANDSGQKDDDGEYSDWIELRNHGEQAVNLAGLRLTDSRKNVGKWILPAVTLAPGAELLVFASGKSRNDPSRPLHASFKLSAKGDYLALISVDGRTVIHEFNPKYPDQKSNTSYGIGRDWRPGKTLAEHEQFFLEPTPGKTNSDRLLGEVGAVASNQKRGFRYAPFELKLTTPTEGAVIRYTTNGSEPSPTEGSTYQAPLAISQTTVLRVAAFKPGHRPTPVDTHTFIFPKDVIHQSPDGLPPEGFPYLWGKNLVDYGMDPRIVNDPRYRDEMVASLKSLPSFSIVTSMDNIFGETNGVYSNPGEQGRESERPCSLELLHPDGGPEFQINCGIRIRGGFSRMLLNAKHAFRLFFREEYGQGKLKFPLFGKDAAQEIENFDLRTFQNYSWHLGGDPRGIMLRDQVNRDLQLAMGQPATRGDFYHLYVNGHYWGLYNTCERVEASYGATYLGGKKADYDTIKVDSGFTTRQSTYNLIPTDGNMDAWKRLYQRAAAGLSNNADYFALQGCRPDGTRDPSLERLLDVDNLIDYMLVIFWGGNLDAPISAFGGNRNPNNYHSLYRRTNGDGFKFFVWDAEHTMLNLQEDRTGPFNTGTQMGTSSPQWLWQQCVDNPEFRLRVADLVHQHFSPGGVLTPESVQERFNARAKQIESAVVAESARWGDVKYHYSMNPPKRVDDAGNALTGPFNREDDWRREVNRLRTNYLPQRSGIVRNQLFAQGLLPDLQPPQLKQADGGQLTLSTSTAGADIYYTTDGTDPRLVGGGVSPKAVKYSASAAVGGNRQAIKARSVIDGDWSALAITR